MADTPLEIDIEQPKWGPASALLVTLIIYFASQLLAGVVLFVFLRLTGWGEAQTQTWLEHSAVGQFILIAIVEALTLGLLWWFLKHRKAGFRDVGLKSPRIVDIGYALAGFVSYFIAYIVLLGIVKSLFPSLDISQEQQLGFSKNVAGFQLLYVFISLVILPPIVEEIVARGFLYTGLRSKLPKIAAALITSVIFALAHLQWGSGAPLLWVAALDTFTLSLVLVYLREKTDSLAAPIGVHMIKNALAFAVLFDIGRYIR